MTDDAPPAYPALLAALRVARDAVAEAQALAQEAAKGTPRDRGFVWWETLLTVESAVAEAQRQLAEAADLLGTLGVVTYTEAEARALDRARAFVRAEGWAGDLDVYATPHVDGHGARFTVWFVDLPARVEKRIPMHQRVSVDLLTGEAWWGPALE